MSNITSLQIGQNKIEIANVKSIMKSDFGLNNQSQAFDIYTFNDFEDKQTETEYVYFSPVLTESCFVGLNFKHTDYTIDSPLQIRISVGTKNKLHHHYVDSMLVYNSESTLKFLPFCKDASVEIRFKKPTDVTKFSYFQMSLFKLFKE